MKEYHYSKIIHFIKNDIDDLAQELSKPFKKISVVYPNKPFLIEKDRWISSVTLWDTESSGLKINSFMTDVAERVEVGSLRFERVVQADGRDEFFHLDDSFAYDTTLKKIIIDESGSRIETGIIINAVNSAQILIIPNAMPNSLALRCAQVAPKYFEPEYSLEDYVLESFD